MKLKTSDLVGPELNYAVHMAEGLHGMLAPVEYSTRWEFGGPIIEGEGITVARSDQKSYADQPPWVAYRLEHLFMDEYEHEYQHGPTPLIAAMRCYVASKLGDEIDFPEVMK